MPDKKSGDFVIVVDSRETKYPYLFAGELFMRKSLMTGDYSVQGFEQKVAVERKTITDLYSSLSTRRINFMAEMNRMRLFDCGVLMIEGTYDQVINAPKSSYVRKFSKMQKNSILGSLIKIEVEYGIGIVFAGSRRNAEEFTLRILKAFFDKKRSGKI